MNDDVPKPKKRKWLAIILGVLFVFGMLAVGCVVATVAFFRQNMNVTETSEQAAMRQMDDVRGKFPGQQPLIQLVDGKPQLVAERATESRTQTTLSTVHVIAFDRDKGNLMNLSLPFWVLRMKSGPIRISAYQQGWDDRGVSFRVEDIEKHGPGIIADVTKDGEGRVVVWAE
ncbi:MAG TPA: hypothetical protein VM096_19030 [Vicinamibacterales bacterium]|nr:hypothetical protein [Vicinamibacterales bacterium]